VGNDVLQSVDVIFSSNGVEFRAKERDFPSTFNGICVTEIVEESSVLDKINLSHLDDSQKLKVQQLVTEYKPIKSIESPVSMRIVLEDDIPVYQRPRHVIREQVLHRKASAGVVGRGNYCTQLLRVCFASGTGR